MIKKTKIKNGWVRGVSAADPRIISYKGIPYAAPPVGELRWKAPAPHSDWDGIRDCLEFSSIAMQSIPGLDQNNIYTKEWNVDPEIPMSEDCLYLNVWTPAACTEERLPVFLWFHGGALQWGNSAEMEFDGERIARRGIVVVTINYRLNVFGFLVHPELVKEGTLNFGNLDQQYALRWVRENIASFGGDPEHIVIGGQSAGGGSVLTQLSSRWNQGLIKGAVIESGIFCDPFQKLFQITKEEALRQGRDFLEFLGADSLEEARCLPAEYIWDKNDEFGKFWGTVIDGDFLRNNPFDGIQKKEFMDVPLLHGWTDNEFITDDGTNAIEIGNRLLCRMRKEYGYQTPDYLYEFAPEIPGEDRPGAFHSSDLWFFFETLAKCHRPFKGWHYDLAADMCDYWCSFIKTGKPGNWQNYEDDKVLVMKFVMEPKLVNYPASELVQCHVEEFFQKQMRKEK